MSRTHTATLAAIAIVIVAGQTAPSGQQQTAAPQHKHYVAPPGYEQTPAPGQPLAPRLQNLGVHTFPVTTRSARAQLFINQGVNLAYAFNHAEAARSFAEAARLDPDCAMAYWGHALVLGPNINATMTPEDEPKALELAQKAVAQKAKASPRERAYIDALAARYTGRPEDRPAANQAFAAAMRRVVAAYPADTDARAIFSESLMNLRPWNYWTRDGLPYDETREVITSLERVLARNRNHPGALHLWIHLWEPTDTPERAEAEAVDALGHVPGFPTGAHVFARHVTVGDSVRTLAVGDFNEDNALDLVVGRTLLQYATTMLLGLKTGSVPNGDYAAPVDYAVGGEAAAVVDYDGDGRSDVITASALLLRALHGDLGDLGHQDVAVVLLEPAQAERRAVEPERGEPALARHVHDADRDAVDVDPVGRFERADHERHQVGAHDHGVGEPHHGLAVRARGA